MHLVLLLYALFAAVFVISKVGLEFTAPLFFVGSRMLLAGLLLLAYQATVGRASWRWRKTDFALFFGLGLFNIYITNACEFWGLQYLTAFKTCFIYSLSPFFAALLSYFIFSEVLSRKKWLGLFIGFLGFIPIFLHETAQESSLGHFFFFSWAELSVMTAAMSTVYGWILMKQLVGKRGYTSVMANGISMLIGGTLAMSHSYLVEPWNPVPVFEWVPFLECTLLAMLVSNLICYNLYGWLLKRFSATFLSFAGFSTPLFTAVLGWLVLGEAVSWHFYAASVVVFSGLLLFYQEELVYSRIRTEEA